MYPFVLNYLTFLSKSPYINVYLSGAIYVDKCYVYKLYDKRSIKGTQTIH